MSTAMAQGHRSPADGGKRSQLPMARFIEVQRRDKFPALLAARVGDVLVFHATGAQIIEGAAAIEVLGPFVMALLGEDGQVVTPTGSPNAVLARAAAPGQAMLELFIGQPFHSRKTTTIALQIDK